MTVTLSPDVPVRHVPAEGFDCAGHLVADWPWRRDAVVHRSVGDLDVSAAYSSEGHCDADLVRPGGDRLVGARLEDALSVIVDGEVCHVTLDSML